MTTLADVQTQRDEWLTKLRADLLQVRAEIDRQQDALAALRTRRDELERAIRELTPRKRRGAGEEGGADNE